ncbi:MAG: D-glycero-beta-D-manno-heptose 1-phosphate adenylyltransferase [Candidatus Omnitrophota bacterium]
MRLIEDKIKPPGELRNITLKFKKQGKKIAFTNGCFDILHYGHVIYLQKAKGVSNILVVALNSDSSIRRIKEKGRPIVKLENRLKTIAALESVDFVTYFTQDTPLELIKLLKPDILIKGGDWDKNKIVGRDIVQAYGGRVISLPYIKGQSSSKIIEKIGKNL